MVPLQQEAADSRDVSPGSLISRLERFQNNPTMDSLSSLLCQSVKTFFTGMLAVMMT